MTGLLGVLGMGGHRVKGLLGIPGTGDRDDVFAGPKNGAQGYRAAGDSKRGPISEVAASGLRSQRVGEETVGQGFQSGKAG